MKARGAGSNVRQGQGLVTSARLTVPAPELETTARENCMSGPDTMDRPGRWPGFRLAQLG